MLIDASFVDVLCDDSDERHEAAAGAFEGLLTEFERGTTLLYSHGGVVAEVGARRRAELLAVCHVVRRRRWLLVIRGSPVVAWFLTRWCRLGNHP